MTWIVLTALLAIAFWVGVGMRAVGRRQPMPTEGIGMPMSQVGLLIAAGSVALWLLVSAWLSLHTVGQREVAIVYNFSGTIAGKKDPGVVMTAPWQHVKKENVGIRHDEFVFTESNAAVSADQQKVFASLSVNYRIDPENVVDLYKRVGPSWKTIIVDARVPQDFKEITATYSTQKITEQREKLRSETKARLAEELKPYDIEVVDVFVTNLGFSQTYTDSIEAKQKQVQDALRAEAKVREVEAEAKQQIASAEGQAKANVARARGEATANRLRQRSLTPLLVQLQAVEKLNPNVQMIICPPNSVCIPNSPVIPQPQNP